MKHIDEHRDPAKAARLRAIIAGLAARTGPVRLMEVCGTHTMAVFRFGLKAVLPPEVELISGPGCPVCVTPTAEIDRAIEAASRPKTILAVFGDMLRVPGSKSSLAQAKALGARAEVVYSPLDALDLARRRPREEIVFWALGFETTAPTVAAAVIQARQEGLPNFSILSGHKLLPPALEALLDDPDLRLSGLVLPGHVTTIIGAGAYQDLAARHGLPCVVTGFEPLDILQAVAMLLKQVAEKGPKVEIQYGRGAAWSGNARALALMDQVFEPGESRWRGLGTIPGSGLHLRPDWTAFDAARRFDLGWSEVPEPAGCACGEVLRGRLRPQDCPLFGRACRPERPVGPCMVSSEGACAAWAKYSPPERA